MAPPPAPGAAAPPRDRRGSRPPGWLRRLARAPVRDGRLLVSVVLIIGLALAASFAAIRAAEYRLLKSRATGTAVHWAQFLQTRLNGLDEILVAGLVSEDDQRTLDFASAAGGVRDYQVIRPDGIVALSSWSGDFRGAIDRETALSVIHDERTLADIVEETRGANRLVIGQAFVPIAAGAGRRGALKVNVDMSREAAHYRRLGNGAFLMLLALLLPPGGACWWLIHRNIRERRGREQLEGQRGRILEELAVGTATDVVLLHIAGFAEQHYRPGRCAILTLDPTGKRVDKAIAIAGANLRAHLAGHEVAGLPPAFAAALRPDATAGTTDSPEGKVWSTPLHATSGTLIGSFSLSFASARQADEASFGPATTLAQLAALAIERRRAEDALADMRQRHESILNAAGDGIFGVDAEDRVIFANPAAARLLRRDAAAMIGRDAVALIEGPEASRRLQSPILAALRDGSGRKIDHYPLQRGDGSAFTADLVVTPVHRQATSLRAVVVFHDITAQIETQRQLRRAKEEAEGASRAKSSFLAHMSHELRTPLNAVIGFSEVMARQILGPIGNSRYQEYAQHIHGSGAHLLALINDLLDLSKIEAGKLELAEETVDLAALLERCTLFVSETVHTNRLALAVDVAADLTEVRCDPRKLKQVVINLLSNAVKFTPAGGRIGLAAWRDDAGELCIRVEDSGTGIAAEDMEKVMTPFGQAGEALDRRQRGTGLGLPLAKALVELHGGSLALASQRDHGTVVTIRLPGRAVAGREARAVA
jgi:PAS domain S-box-containing protein